MGPKYRYVQHSRRDHVVCLPPEDCHLLVSSGRYVALSRGEGRAKFNAQHGRSFEPHWRVIGITASAILVGLAVLAWLRAMLMI